MGLFKKSVGSESNRRSESTASGAGDSAPAALTDPAGPWADINAVRGEWPRESLDEAADLAAWQDGVRLYDNDDYPSMMRCAVLLSRPLAHCLYGEGILRGADLPETIHKVLYSSLTAPPDMQTFAETAQRAARLALTVIRENGWQPSPMGGAGLFDQLIMDQGNFLLLKTAIGPADQPWLGDLQAFFAVPPSPPEVHPARNTHSQAVVDRMLNTHQAAEAGDEMSEAHMRGMALWAQGHPEDALAALAEAGRLGSADAMKDAGDLAQQLGRDGEARFWFESAANAGHAGAMYNMGVFAGNLGDFDTAAVWWQRAAEAGDEHGYAALTQVAENRGDESAARNWARLGAEAGQPFCMSRHGMHLLLDHPADLPMTRRAVVFLDAAGEAGEVDAMMFAVDAHGRLGQVEEQRKWAARARATGEPRIIAMLDKYGY